MTKRTTTFFFMLIAVCGLAGCNDKPEPLLSMSSVTIFAEPDANDNSATAVDLVVSYDRDLLTTLSQMSAAKYFEFSNQLLLDNPSLVDVWHWELVPGQMVQNFAPSQDKGLAYGAFVYANYLSPGDHRVRVPPDGVVHILLLKKDLKIQATANTSEAKKGTTVTDAQSGGGTVCGGIVNGSSVKGCSVSGGSVLPQSCKRVAPKPCVQSRPGPIQLQQSPPSSRKPIPIVVRDLPSVVKKHPHPSVIKKPPPKCKKR